MRAVSCQIRFAGEVFGADHGRIKVAACLIRNAIYVPTAIRNQCAIVAGTFPERYLHGMKNIWFVSDYDPDACGKVIKAERHIQSVD